MSFLLFRWQIIGYDANLPILSQFLMSPCRIWGDRSGKWNYKGWRRNSRIKAADGRQSSLGSAPLHSPLSQQFPVREIWFLLHNTTLGWMFGFWLQSSSVVLLSIAISALLSTIVPKVIFRHSHSFNIKSVNIVNNGVSCHCFLVAVLGSTTHSRLNR